ncbi:NUDIX hydrolase [Aquisalibacillus elongatus]|uniref:8-oxo-dGTP diphosphatase n=1 Tax=Aquisalibacillus elongatus TaxID=485577 RepID=A0A3N5C4N9_9BACI|nr:8-oxo-dGTP diphosphatase [Aquisalibacillus elongatus]RPF54392.1 8-oxo-dGTP diphosphatase [Aquisalibacillus elongatus]
MQRVTNAVYIKNNHVLMLKKPKRGWYGTPGGKMEPGESIKQSVLREFEEETGLLLTDAKLSSAFTFVIEDEQEWMLFTFVAQASTGQLLEETPEGELEWVPFDKVLDLPMAEGDRRIIKHAISDPEYVLTGTFYYTQDYILQKEFIDGPSELVAEEE